MLDRNGTRPPGGAGRPFAEAVPEGVEPAEGMRLGPVLAALLLDELGEPDAATLRRAVAAAPELRGELDELRATLGALRTCAALPATAPGSAPVLARERMDRLREEFARLGEGARIGAGGGAEVEGALGGAVGSVAGRPPANAGRPTASVVDLSLGGETRFERFWRGGWGYLTFAAAGAAALLLVGIRIQLAENDDAAWIARNQVGAGEFASQFGYLGGDAGPRRAWAIPSGPRRGSAVATSSVAGAGDAATDSRAFDEGPALDVARLPAFGPAEEGLFFGIARATGDAAEAEAMRAALEAVGLPATRVVEQDSVFLIVAGAGGPDAEADLLRARLRSSGHSMAWVAQVRGGRLERVLDAATPSPAGGAADAEDSGTAYQEALRALIFAT